MFTKIFQFYSYHHDYQPKSKPEITIISVTKSQRDYQPSTASDLLKIKLKKFTFTRLIKNSTKADLGYPLQ